MNNQQLGYSHLQTVSQVDALLVYKVEQLPRIATHLRPTICEQIDTLLELRLLIGSISLMEVNYETV